MPRLAFKAGRAFRRGDTNFVDPSPTKGAIILQNGDDGLLHFIWKNRVTNEEEEDLILFPADATFVKVTQSAWGRTYVLKFSSSDQRHFVSDPPFHQVSWLIFPQFWMQDADPARDGEFVRNVNRLLQDPNVIPIWWTGPPGADGAPNNAVPITITAAGPSTAARPGAPVPGLTLTPEALARLRSVVASGGSGRAGAPPSQEQEQPEASLTDILTPANLAPLFNSHPEVIQTLFPHLPPDLPASPSPEVLQQIIVSPQFRAAVRNVDMALRTGLLGGLVRSLGLPEEAGTGIEAFLRAIQDQANREGAGTSGESMDTD